MRSFLTMLGIIIGIASIIAIVSTIKGTNDQIKESLVGAGNNSVDVLMYQNGNQVYIYSSSDIPFGFRQVSDETKEKILALDTVENVTCYNVRQSADSVYYQNTALSDFKMLGIDMDYFSTCSYSIKTGRNFIQDDYDKFRKVVILDDTAANNLFGKENPLGKTIEISSIPFTVIGVVTEDSSSTPSISSISQYYNYSSDSTGTVFMSKAAWPIIYTYDEPENVIVRATSTDDMEKAGSDTASILNATITSDTTEVKYKAENLAEQARKLQDLSASTNNLLIWIASISLLVGGIGVMNIMLVSVTERTSEIGLKKAIGARKSTILGQFLTEAAVLTSMGGIIGVITGIGMAKIIEKVSDTPVSISVPAIVIAVVFSMLIGIVFGFLPSVQAANLDPIEALRRE
jgi:putative ABC transport system permease protein